MYANDPWSNIELQDPSRSLNNKEKRSTKHRILESGYCFFLSSPIYVSRCFFLASLWRKAGCNDGDLCRFFSCFIFGVRLTFFFFVRNARVCLAHHCQFCPEFIGMGIGVEGGLFLYPIPFIFSITRKKNNHILSSFEKRSRQFDFFFQFFFLNTSVWLNRMYWSGSLLNRAVDYCAPSMPTKKNKNKKQRVQVFWQNLAALKMVTTLDEWWPFFILLHVPKKIKEQH